MTTSHTLIDPRGRAVPLERQLASGGEGAVFAILNDPIRVAKVYHRPPSPQTAAKLAAMVQLANRNLTSLAAWPEYLLYQAGTRQLAGFVMPRLQGCQPIQHLYNPIQRLQHFPRAGWKFQVRAAKNLAAAFDEVHKAGCLVGDVNQSNAYVSEKAIVWLIDCDSFQVPANGRAFLCEVGVAHYTPPELQGKPLRGLLRTENHDRFGLAVLLYQLLFVGRHPYAGVYGGAGDPSFEQLIAEFRFAQGPLAHTWNMAPPPHTPTLADIPPKVGDLFRKAFERGSERGTRPHPTEWLHALDGLEREMAECPVDTGHTYWRGARSCVWCRLASGGGPEYYFGVGAGSETFAVDEARVQEVVRRLNACREVEFPYDRSLFASARPVEPEPLPEGAEDHPSVVVVLAVVLALCVLGIPLGLLHWAFSAGGLLGTLVFGAWLAVHYALSPWHREYRRRKRARDLALSGLEDVEDAWHQHVRRYRRDHDGLRRSVQGLIDECRGLTTQYQAEMQRLTASAESLARTRHMRLHLISDADIPKIGAGRKQLLATYSVFTAEDINYHVIRGIKGFGDVLTGALLQWKEEVLRRFRFEPRTAVSPAEQRALAMQLRTRQQQLFAEMERQLARLVSLAGVCRAAHQELVPRLQEAVTEYEQAEADLQVFH